VTPGEAKLAKRELELADEALGEASLLLDANAARGAMSRLYYATFHAARAALAVRGVYAKTHSGQISVFGKTFGPATITARLLELRAQADYGREELTESPDELRVLVEEAREFVARCREIVAEALSRGADEPDPLPDY
jgi:uncharacterized protein (UPF0332 family)